MGKVTKEEVDKARVSRLLLSCLYCCVGYAMLSDAAVAAGYAKAWDEYIKLYGSSKMVTKESVDKASSGCLGCSSLLLASC